MPEIVDIGNAELDRMIAAHPRVLRKGVIDALNRLEAAIQAVGAPGEFLYWLRRYRNRKENSAVPWYGIYCDLPPYVERLDAAFVAFREYREEDYVCCDARKNVRTSFAKSGGDSSAESVNQLKKFATDLFDAEHWESVSKARHAIWPKVKDESKRLGRPLTDTRGPATLYEWLLHHKKTIR